MNLLFVLLLITASQITSVAQNSPVGNRRTWGRSIVGDRIPDGKSKHLELLDITQESAHLVGLFALSRDGDATMPPLAVQGHLDRAGIFTANVALDVSNEMGGGWKSIESSLSEKVEARLTVAPETSSVSILVQLDAFQPYIEKYRFARVALQTGESTTFSLSILSHPSIDANDQSAEDRRTDEQKP